MSDNTVENIEDGLTDNQGEEHRILNKTQKIREFIVDRLTANGEEVPKGRDLDRLLMTMEGLDSQSLTLRKLRAEELAAKGAGQDKMIIAGLLKQLERTPTNTVVIVERETPTLPEELDKYEFVPGEMRIGTIAETHEEFMARRKKERGEE